MRALVKLERRVGRFWEEILLPGRRIPGLRMHPPTESRIVSVRLSRSDGVMECLLDVHQR